jgi:hypothetical protein
VAFAGEERSGKGRLVPWIWGSGHVEGGWTAWNLAGDAGARECELAGVCFRRHVLPVDAPTQCPVGLMSSSKRVARPSHPAGCNLFGLSLSYHSLAA